MLKYDYRDVILATALAHACSLSLESTNTHSRHDNRWSGGCARSCCGAASPLRGMKIDKTGRAHSLKSRFLYDSCIAYVSFFVFIALASGIFYWAFNLLKTLR